MNEKFWIIEIFKKDKFKDVFGEETKKNIEELGIKNVKKVRVANLYKIFSDTDKDRIKEVGKKLFVDVISEDFKVYRFRRKKNIWTVEVWLKEGVSDPVGETARKTIIESGILKNVSVRTGKKYYIEGNIKKEIVRTICEKILANTLIHDYVIYKKGEK